MIRGIDRLRHRWLARADRRVVRRRIGVWLRLGVLNRRGLWL